MQRDRGCRMLLVPRLSYATRMSKHKADAARYVEPFTITNGKGFRLKDFSAKDTRGLKDKVEAEHALAAGVERLAALQEKLYAQDRWGMLLIFQAMDAAGKDSAIEHVMSGVNPQGCQVFSFKAPSAEELDHDFLWRTTRCMPERGRIGIFNRSYYEESARRPCPSGAARPISASRAGS